MFTNNVCVAQLVEWRSPKPLVGSSSLPAGAKQIDMRIIIDDSEYIVQWMYNEETDTTSCVISTRYPQPSDDVVHGTSVVKRYYKDKPSLVAACQYSLAKALSHAGFTKQQRTPFWEQFLAKRPTGFLVQ